MQRYTMFRRLIGEGMFFLLGMCLINYVHGWATPSQDDTPSLIPSLDLQGHRGARGLMPENTIPAFKEALRYGMNTLELDVSLTQDGHLLVYHDTHLNLDLCLPTQDIPPYQDQPTLIQFSSIWLKTLDCGSLAHSDFPEQTRIPKITPPLLAEVFQLEHHTQKHPLYNLEIKVDPSYTRLDKIKALQALKAILEDFKAKLPTLYTRLTLQSFDLDVLELAPQYLPNLRRSALFAPSHMQWTVLQLHSSLHGLLGNPGVKIIQKAHQLGVEVISPYMDYVNPNFIQYAHSLKLKVIPWTVNDSQYMKRLIRDGVDGLISDYPDRLSTVVKEMGRSVECRTSHSDALCRVPVP